MPVTSSRFVLFSAFSLEFSGRMVFLRRRSCVHCVQRGVSLSAAERDRQSGALKAHAPFFYPTSVETNTGPQVTHTHGPSVFGVTHTNHEATFGYMCASPELCA